MSGIFRVATFNLENLDERPGLDPPLDARIAVLRPQLERLRADVVLLQEVDGQPRAAPRTLHALDRLLEGTAYRDYHRISTESPSGGALDRQNLVVLSRWPFAARRQIHHELVDPPHMGAVRLPGAGEEAELRWDRPILYGALVLPGGRRLHLLDLHLRAPLAAHLPGEKSGAFSWKSVAGWARGFTHAAIKRSGQALEARLFIEGLFDEEADAWIVVSGDFNAETIEMPTRILMADPGDTGNNALADRALVAVDSLVPEDRRYSVLHAGRRLLLDHLLVSRPLARRVVRAEIHNEALDDELVGYAGQGGPLGSYHAPLVVEFESEG